MKGDSSPLFDYPREKGEIEMQPPLLLVIPKGRLQEKITLLLARIGIEYSVNNRSYRPVCSDPAIKIKLLKPQNIPSLIALGRHDCGFTGLDWVLEEKLATGRELTELLDLGYDKVRIIAAMPEELARSSYKDRQLVIATEYQELAKDYVAQKKLNAVLIKTYGATEALPPEDADMIIDNTSTGSTLQMNRLEIVDELMQSTTRFVANKESLTDPWKKEKLEQMTLLMKSTLLAGQRVLLEMNVSPEHFDTLVQSLPCMRSPTVSPLYGNTGYAIKVSVPSVEVPKLIPQIIALGATDILEYRLEKIVP